MRMPRPRSLLVATLAVPLLTVAAGGASEAHARGRKKRRSVAAQKVQRVATTTRDGQPNVLAQASVIVDLKTGEELYTKNPDEVRPIASISKLMAVQVVLDRGLKLDETQTIAKDDKKVAYKGARSRLLEGWTFKNRDLLLAALIASDNRAIPALGRSVGLSGPELAAEMTKKAKALGLAATEFKDPTGLDDGNVSTPRETVKMLKAALANPTIAGILPLRSATIFPVGKPGKIEYTNTDRLTGSDRWQVLGGKTGYTDLAHYCLVVAARLSLPQGGTREVAMAFLGEQAKLTRFGDFSRSAQWIASRPASSPPPATAAAAPTTPVGAPAQPAAAPATPAAK
jgi:D-alanyl-D-alanine endopeptidase (penicillin-binding protein 7)